MHRLAKPFPLLALLATLGSLVSCDQGGTAPEPDPPHQDTTAVLDDSNDILDASLPDAYEKLDSSSEYRGGPLVPADSSWIQRTLHRTAGGAMEDGDLFEVRVDSGTFYTIHLLARGNLPSIGFVRRGILPIDTQWTRWNSGNTRLATLSFPAHRSGSVHFAAMPDGPDFKPVHYRVSVTAAAGIPSGVYPDLYEFDDTPEFASLLFPEGKVQTRTLHRNAGVSDTDQILLLNLTGANQILELRDSLQAVALEAFSSEGTPLVLPEIVTDSVRCYLVPPPGNAPVRIRLSNRLAVGVAYRIVLRAP